MIKGLYAAASAMVAGMKRQSALAHNIANLETPGFRQIMLAMDDWYVTPVRQDSEQVFPQMDVNHREKPGYTGLGTETSPEITDFSQGAIKATDNELDLAINGTGFFRVKTPDGVRYTRDGRFLRDANNQLVTTNGYFVLDANGQVINLPDGSVRIDESGNITSTNGTQVTQISLVAFKDPLTELTRDGMNTFAAQGAPTGSTPGSIEQGYLESSNASVETLMTQMIAVSRAYEAAQRVVQMVDGETGTMINSLSR
jgi:flagellar basal-body rod protein FlgF